MDEDFASYAQARQQHLFRTAYLLCGDRDRAQDLVQSTLVALLRSWNRASRVENPEAYARKALVRTFLSEQRKLRREVAAHRLPDPVPGGANPTLRVLVVDALRALPPKPRTMIILRYWEDLSVAQTAALLGWSEGNVKSQCSRSLEKMKELLGSKFHDLIEN
jgi:RNA polymerase sigma-70 factor (sigma-E family)